MSAPPSRLWRSACSRFVASALFLGLGSGLAQGTTERGSIFLPAEGGARESDILDEIRAELGETVRPAAHSESGPTAPPSSAPRQSQWQAVALRFANGKEIVGQIRSVALPLLIETKNGSVAVPADGLQALTFSEWRVALSMNIGTGRRTYHIATICIVTTTAGVALEGKCRPYSYLAFDFKQDGTVLSRAYTYFRGEAAPSQASPVGTTSQSVLPPPETVVTGIRFAPTAAGLRRTAQAEPGAARSEQPPAPVAAPGGRE